MKRAKANGAEWGGTTLSLAVLTATQHPDISLRRAVADLLEPWVQDGAPKVTDEELRACFRSARGSAAAPFEAQDSDVETTVLLARIVFSDRMNASRFRYVSRDCFGDDYGITVTDNLEYFVTGRGLGRRPRRADRPVCLFAPGHLESVLPQAKAAPMPTPVSATMSIGAEGIVIEILRKGWSAGWTGGDGELEEALTTHSRVAGGKSFKALGLRVRAARQAVVIQPVGSEGTMRLTALQSRGATLLLDPGEALNERPGVENLLVKLRPSDADLVTLTGIPTSRLPALATCMRFFPGVVPDLPFDLKLLLSRRVYTHFDWVTEQLIERLL